MEESYKKKMEALGYDHFVCEIFGDWENVKDEILLPDRKSGSGNGTVHSQLRIGNIDSGKLCQNTDDPGGNNTK